MKGFFGLLFIFAILLGAAYWYADKLAAESRAIPPSPSLSDNRLWPCPPLPNCVNSDAQPTEKHFVVPIADEDGTRWAKLITVVDAMDGTELVQSTNDYAYFTFTRKFVHFVDDVEFHNRPRDKLIAVRSATRVGRFDLGVNRRRIEDIRVALGLYISEETPRIPTAR